MAIDDVAICVKAKGVKVVSEAQESKLCQSGLQAIGAFLSLQCPSHRCHSGVQMALAALEVSNCCPSQTHTHTHTRTHTHIHTHTQFELKENYENMKCTKLNT